METRFCLECKNFEDRIEIDGHVVCGKSHDSGVGCLDFEDRLADVFYSTLYWANMYKNGMSDLGAKQLEAEFSRKLSGQELAYACLLNYFKSGIGYSSFYDLWNLIGDKYQEKIPVISRVLNATLNRYNMHRERIDLKTIFQDLLSNEKAKKVVELILQGYYSQGKRKKREREVTFEQNKILFKEKLSSHIDSIKVKAPTIARKAKAGQFIVLRTDDSSERIPLTLIDWDEKEGTITLVFQKVGLTTEKLGDLSIGNKLQDLVGPLGNPAESKYYGRVCVIGGGTGIAAAYPRARMLKNKGNDVTVIIGAQTAELLIFEKKIKYVSDQLYITTDDGSKGQKGFVSDALESLLESKTSFDFVFAVGPVAMMKSISEITKPYKIKTIVSLNTLMVDGTGMCGCCRVSLGGKTLFACLDGPEFNSHLVDFEELMNRLKIYSEEERSVLLSHEEVYLP